MSATKLILTLLTSLLLFTGCGGAGTAANTIGTGNSPDDSQSGSSTDEEIKEPVNENYTFNANYKDDKYRVLGEGQLLHYNSTDKTLEITVPFPFAAFMPDSSGTLPNQPHISFTTSSTNKTLSLSIPVNHYVELVENPTSLPSGRPLPEVNGGEPPSFGFPLHFMDLNAYGYAAFDSFSIFVESSFNQLPISFSLPITGEDDGHLGKIHWLAPMNIHPGGIFLSIRLPKELSVILANAQ